MVIPPVVRSSRITRFLKPYFLKMHFINKYVNAQVTHSPTATVASSASSQEKVLRSMECARDVAALSSECSSRESQPPASALAGVRHSFSLPLSSSLSHVPDRDRVCFFI
ncbi:hypothetical protein NE237_003687 [Protea cynaroides]|uniref:Uncharacterized protein n=1 Tax=Protea cynaroides TaxID=273540 RepID=A0A9Q0QSU5_9MAGN|nr:hypothetical protein NE237_003687 [Protea cynaroides]